MTNNIDIIIDNLKCLEMPTIIKTNARIVAIGDIHGDFNALKYSLYAAALINEKMEWIGGDSILVQTGDIFDDKRPIEYEPPYTPRNPNFNSKKNELEMLEYITNLAISAKKNGGGIVLCLGNHEAMSFLSNNSEDMYLSENTKKFYGEKGRKSYLEFGSKLCKKLACIYKIGVLINDCLFCHGGFNIINLPNIIYLDAYNRTLSELLNDNINPEKANYFIKNVLTNNIGPLWDRSSSRNFVEPNNSNICINFEKLKSTLKIPTLKLIVGHTPHKVINGVCDLGYGNTIYRIDTSMSEAFGTKDNKYQRINILDIDNDMFRAIIITDNLHTSTYDVKYLNYKNIIPDYDTYIQTKYKTVDLF